MEAATSSIYERDRKVENARITEGADIDYEQIREIVVDNGGAIHFVGHISKRSLVVSGIKTVFAGAACIGLSYLFD